MSQSNERPVLAAVDLAAASDEAIGQANAWARRIRARLVVCHAIPDLVRIQPLLPHLASRSAADIPALHERVAAALSERVGGSTGRGPDEVEIVVEEGAAAATVVRIADERNPALIVVGASEKGGLERALLGSTAEQIVRHAHAPVLVARSSPAGGAVMAATDFSEAAEPALVAAAKEAARRGARLALVHALELPSPALAAFDASAVLPTAAIESMRAACQEMLDAALARLGATGETRVVDGPPAIAIARAAADLAAALVVVGTHGRTGLTRFALGSVAAAVVRTAPSSVLVVRGPA